MNGYARALEAVPEPPARPANISHDVLDGNSDEHVGDRAGETDVRELVALAQKGDREAFGELYRLYHGRVLAVARFSVPQCAEDVAAETFLRAWTALPRYRDRGVPFVAWLYGIVRRVVADEHRRRARVEVVETVPDAAVGDNTAGLLDLRAALARLPYRQRQIVEMKYLLALTNPEVAAALGKSIGAVNAQQWRALAALRRALEDFR